MAHFVLAPDRTLTHFAPEVTESLGQAAPEVTEGEVVAWLAAVAQPFDRITTPEGTFALLPPAKKVSRGFFNQPPATSHLS
jgi:hypothetical protein